MKRRVSPAAEPSTDNLLSPEVAELLAREELEIFELLTNSPHFGDLAPTFNPAFRIAGLQDDDPEVDRRLDQQKTETLALARAVRPYLRAAIDAGVRDYLEAQRIAPEVLDGIRRFCMEDIRPTYTVVELAEMWGTDPAKLFEFFDDYFKPVAVHGHGNNSSEEPRFSRADAGSYLVSYLASPSVLAAALGDDLPAVLNAARITVPLVGLVPRFVAETLRSSPETNWMHGATAADGIAHLVTMYACDEEPPAFRS